MGKQRVRVTISDSKLIPTIGKGPINKPISITVPQYEMLKKFGFNIVKVEEQLSKIERAEETKVSEPEQKVDEVVVPPAETPSEPEQSEELTTDEEPEQVVETPEEVVEVSGESEEEVVYTEEDLQEATKKELKEVLDARGVEYKHNDTLPTLKELVLSSNPQ
jgi:hypothetical protein